MVGVDDLIEGAAFGVGAVAVGAVAIFGGPRSKPYAKRAMKSYMVFAHRAQEAAAEAAERVQDLYHEARHEYESELNGTASPSAEMPTAPKRRRTSRSRSDSAPSASRPTRARSAKRAATGSAR